MKRFTLLLFLVMGLLLVACGGDDPGEDDVDVGDDIDVGEEDLGEEEAGAASLAFEGTDSLTWVPDSATAPAGSEVEVTVTSSGALEHKWVLAEPGVDAATLPLEAEGLASTDVIPGGETETITFTAPEAGTYTYVCTVPGHAAAGMVGTLTVE